MATTAAAPGRIHRMELYNFKSYQGKVSVGPFKDFTCIVGPNGSGKSNIMDALSFALGSSAAALRGDKLTDLINKKARKKECSVTLVLRNASGDEKSLTRGISTKGTVEVSVDGVQCSEKEYASVLRKFRVGSRLGTFLVFQHEVDAVAQKKARELTELLEQVSGSAELKPEYERLRKELEAANKALTDASVERRTVQAELNRLKLQKAEAERYTEVHDRLMQERRDLALGELFFVEAQLTKQKDELAAAAAEVDALQRKTVSEGEHNATKKEYVAKHAKYLDELKEMRKINASLRENKATLERIKASAAHFTAKLARQNEQLGTAKNQEGVRSKELGRLEAQLKTQEAALAQLEAAWAKEDASNEDSRKKLSGKDLQEYRALRRDADCATVTSRQSLETLRRQRDAIADAARNTAQQLERVQASINDDATTIAACEERIKTLEAKLRDHDGQLKDTTLKLDDLKAATHQFKLRASEKDEKLAEIEAQLRELRYMKEDTRHGSRVSEALAALRNMHPGVRGRVYDLVQITDANKYRNAVTVALGKNLDAIVVDTTETAMACVRYLKEQRVASMSFIPLASAKGTAVDDAVRTLGGTCRPVVDLIKYDPSLEPAIRYALGATLVCDTMAEAKRIAYDGAERHKVVTVDGNVLLKNGSVQGGLQSVQQRAKKWDEKHYDDLKARREELVRDGAGAASEAEQLRLRQQGAELQARAEQLESRIARDKAERKAAEEARTKAAQSSAKLREQVTALERAIADAKSKSEALEREMAKRTAEIAKEEEKILGEFLRRVGIPNMGDIEHQEQQRARVRADRRQQHQVAIHRLKTAIDGEERRAKGERAAGDLNAAVETTKKELDTCNADLEKFKRTVDRNSAEQDQKQLAVNALKAELDALEHRLRQRTKDNEAEVRQLAAARKHATLLQSKCEALRHQRLALFQRCRMDEIELPVTSDAAAGAGGAAGSSSKRHRDRDAAAESSGEDSDDDNRAAAGRGGRGGRKSGGAANTTLLLRTSEAFTSFSNSADTSGAAGARAAGRRAPQEVSVVIDFSGLPRKVREAASSAAAFDKFRQEFEGVIDQLEKELEAIAPNLKATAHLQSSEAKLGQSSSSLDHCRDRANKALRSFNTIKEQRTARFQGCFERVVEHVDRIYRELTIGTRAQDVAGSAYLQVESSDEPYLGGTRYVATPPMKQYREMDQLSGGERTMAAMALLFAIHATAPTPFFVLDEVDAALDSGNVVKLAQYLRKHAGAGCQYIVVSLKEQLYHLADGLVGVYKDTARESSGVVTMDLTKVAVTA